MEINDGASYQSVGLFGTNMGTIIDLRVTGSIDISASQNNILIGMISGLNVGTN